MNGVAVRGYRNGGEVKFDAEGGDYDYTTAKKHGMGPDGTGENKGHWGSVAPASSESVKQHNLPEGTYKMLKGKQHPTWSKAVEAEQSRGSEVKKFGDRYYSVPKGKYMTDISHLQSFLQFIIPALVTALSVFLSMRHGLKNITEKVEKISIKLEKIDERQGTTDQHVNLLNYRTSKLEETLEKLVDNVVELERDLKVPPTKK